MHPRGRKAFDVFELDQHDEAGEAADQVRSGSRNPHPRLDRAHVRLGRVSRTDRRLAVATVIALATAVLAGAKARQVDPPIRHITKTNVIAAPVVAVDALGCPVDRPCVTVGSPALVLAAGRAALPSAHVTYAMMELDRDSGAVYRVMLALSAPHTAFQVVSACLPGAAPVTTQPIAVTLNWATATFPIDQPTPPGPKEWTITLASSRRDDPSCGITVTAQSTLIHGIDGRAIDTVVNLLADDSRLMAAT